MATPMWSDNKWIVIGGTDKGGIIVRDGLALASPQLGERLAYGAVVDEVQLVGDRLQYKLVLGTGPTTGWISTKLKSKDLVIRLLPDSLSKGRVLGEANPAMTFFAISDVHAERKENLRWLENLPVYERSTVIVAGDLAVNLTQLEQALSLFQKKFDYVMYCYGNHEAWSKVKNAADKDLASYNDSWEKLLAIRQLCSSLGVLTTATLIEGVWVVPVLGWYHDDWDTEPPLQAPEGEKLQREPMPGHALATDTHACQWGEHKNGTKELAKLLDEQNEVWGIWPLPEALLRNVAQPPGKRKHPVITFSHFLPREELMPEKRFLFQPNLPQIVGSSYIRRRVESLKPDVHVFGHTHFPWDMFLDDGTRYRSWPLGTPEEQARRIASISTEEAEQWLPMPVFDSDGHHYRSSDNCWFSLMYTRVGRDPYSPQWAPYVAMAYCTKAQWLPEPILNGAGCLDPPTEEDRQRRERFTQKSSASMQREVNRGKSA
eukprot:CAMPEP_0206564826 /NCGR_PEP_ID=MMETSP0325_2-20121206/23691_1 /ASSEMBLY_ACC=CAM_ASM_000347 /TAXON_ID=2866 /ORGANISM="Crypthecodinium cohnii, Strain Seligo" /LENGTH=487 /DNA_ID=CAMNT_0054067533 /DNA_START=36 /DNA_END=1499 /DNA_ORIENTATION=-